MPFLPQVDLFSAFSSRVPLHPEAGAGDAGKQRLAALRRTMARLESASPGAMPSYVPLGLPELHRHLPGDGLPCGALHEVIAASHSDRAAGFGFLVALMICALSARSGPTLLVLSRRGLADIGRPYGHGLSRLGFDPGRLLLVETRADKDALWAMEEALRADAGLAVVAGAIEADPDLTMSRRLNLAAGATCRPLLLLRPPGATGLSAATTRWHVAAAPAGRDRFGAFGDCRWDAALERCRNGRPGRWLLEWDHATHRFDMAESLADRALSALAGQKLRHAV